MLCSFADTPGDFSCDGASASSTRIADQANGSALARVDMTIDADTLRDALTRAIDLNETLQDRVAYLSFAPATSTIVSVAPPTATYGEPFDIAVPIPGFYRNRAPLLASDIAALDEEPDPEVVTALRSFRKGVNAPLPFDYFVNLWSGIEALANADAIAAEDYVRSTCPECGATIKGGPAGHQQVRRMFEEGIPNGPKPPLKLADEARSVRGTLAHGGRQHTSDFLDDVSAKGTGLQSVLGSSLSTRLPVPPAPSTCPRVGTPWGLLTISVPGPGSEPEVSPAFDCGFGYAILPEGRHQGQIIDAKIGIFFPIPIQALALPDFVTPS
jgi:hypothetical protein